MTVRSLPTTTAGTHFLSDARVRIAAVGLVTAASFGFALVRVGATALPVIAAAIAVLAAAFVDELTGRIPNRLVLVGFGWTAVGIPVASSIESVNAASVLGDVMVGLLLGGAPILFVVWLLEPALIGGGDWKLLALTGASLGLILPIAAVVASLAACVFQFTRYFVLRERIAPFGPAIAAGLLIALATIPTASRLTGSRLG